MWLMCWLTPWLEWIHTVLPRRALAMQNAQKCESGSVEYPTRVSKNICVQRYAQHEYRRRFFCWYYYIHIPSPQRCLPSYINISPGSAKRFGSLQRPHTAVRQLPGFCWGHGLTEAPPKCWVSHRTLVTYILNGVPWGKVPFNCLMRCHVFFWKKSHKYRKTNPSNSSTQVQRSASDFLIPKHPTSYGDNEFFMICTSTFCQISSKSTPRYARWQLETEVLLQVANHLHPDQASIHMVFL